MNLISKTARCLARASTRYRHAFGAILLSVLIAGCSTTSGGRGATSERYLPAVDPGALGLVFPGDAPVEAATPVGPVVSATDPLARDHGDTVPPMRPRRDPDAVAADDAQVDGATPSDDPAVVVPPSPPSAPAVAPAEDPAVTLVSRGRVLQRGTRVTISLLSIPSPMVIEDKIDDQGRVSLPFIGQLRIAGMSTSAAEALIERTYIEEEFFVKVNATVVPEEQVFYIRGQVNRKGKFPMSRDVTLLQAISEAGGFTPFARESKIQITRHATGEIEFHDAKRISKGQDPNPVIQPNDNINVHRRRY
jgi:protein involved in polysaccharide export with SLBB domain